MATYAIGDIQGCLSELQRLLAHIAYDPSVDQLWFAGDLVNRGSQSLATLRFLKSLPNTHIILGNHDLYLLAMAAGGEIRVRDTLEDVLTAPDRDELLHWLRHLPLLHHDARLGYTMTHAGIYPLWSLAEAQTYAAEFSAVMASEQYGEFMANMYGDQPDFWQESLSGWPRLRFIVNAFTRMRYCTPEGIVDWQMKGAAGQSACRLYPLV